MTRLFDPEPFSHPHRKYRDERVKKPKPNDPIVTIVLGDVWKLLANGRGVHAMQNGRTNDDGALVTYCNVVVGATLAVEPDTTAAACRACLDRGAPR